MMTKKQMKDYMVTNYGMECPQTIRFFHYCEEKHPYGNVAIMFDICRLSADESCKEG